LLRSFVHALVVMALVPGVLCGQARAWAAEKEGETAGGRFPTDVSRLRHAQPLCATR
jgi:hypothetical protein